MIENNNQFLFSPISTNQDEMKKHPKVIATIRHIFLGNKELCANIPEKLLTGIINGIGKGEGSISKIQFLQSVVKVGGTLLR